MGGLWKYWLVYAVGGADGLRECWLIDAVVAEVDGLRRNWLIDAVDEKG